MYYHVIYSAVLILNIDSWVRTIPYDNLLAIFCRFYVVHSGVFVNKNLLV